jgi:hypothetical protein
MKTCRSLILLMWGGAMCAAQNRPSGDVRIEAIIHETKYCLGPTSHFPQKQQPGPSDITLRLSVELLYENHLSRPIILPLGYSSTAQMVVAGQQDAERVGSRGNPFDPNALVDLTNPAPPYFIVIPSGKSSELRYLGEFVYVPVLSPDRRLLGKDIQLSITRDHGLPPSVVRQLQGRWEDSGMLWTGIQKSGTVSVSIPESPATADCRKEERF